MQVCNRTVHYMEFQKPQKFVFMRSFMYLLLFLFAISCSTNRQLNNGHNLPQEEVFSGLSGDEYLEMEIAFIGIFDRSFIFEVSVRNLSSQSFYIDQGAFAMEIGNGIRYPTENMEDIVTEMKRAQKQLKKEKKLNKTLGIISVGVAVISGIALGGDVGQTIAYTLDPLVYSLEEATWINEDIKSVEDHIAYLERATYQHDLIPAYGSLTKDLFFSVTEISAEVEIVFSKDGQEYKVQFDAALFDLTPRLRG